MNSRLFIKEIRSKIPADAFQRTPLRLLWIPVIFSLLVIGAYSFQQDTFSWNLLGTLLLGYGYALMAFLFHDLRHGCLIKNRLAVDVISRFLVWPGLVSQNFWDFWHNQLHHKFHHLESRTLKEYPTESFLKGTWLQKIISKISPPQSGIVGFIYLFFWYVPFIVLIQVLLLLQPGRFKSLRRAAVIFDLTVSVAIWAAWIYFANPSSLILFVVLPYLIQSFLISAFVVTNHHPVLIESKDEYGLDSCTVTLPEWLQFMTLKFGLHLEHHIAPEVSPTHLSKVTDIMKRDYSEAYCQAPLFEALQRIYFSEKKKN